MIKKAPTSELLHVTDPPAKAELASPFLNQKSTSQLLGLSERTLERFRLEGRGPPFLKFGRRVFYSAKDVLAWAERQRRTSTSDPGTLSPGERGRR